MKIFLYFWVVFLSVCIADISAVMAQSTPVFNRPNTTYSTSGPINLQQLLQSSRSGRASAGAGFNNQFYGGQNIRPFGLDNQNFQLGLTPQDVQASRARRDAEARQRERQNMTALEQYNDELAAFERQQQQNAQQRARGNQPAGFSSAPTAGQRFYNPRSRDGFEKPRRVFNSLR